MKKILIIKLGALGDFIIAIGAMVRLREQNPDAEFSLMTNRAFLPIARQMGIFSNYIIDNRGSYFNFKELKRIVGEVIGHGFDTVYDFQCTGRTRRNYYSVFRLLMGKSYEWIDAVNNSKNCVSKKRAFSWGSSTVEPCQVVIPTTDLSFLHGENKHFDELPERFVLMIPGCSPKHPYKRWPVQNFSAVAQRLAEQGIHTVVMGTQAEAEEVNGIVSSTPMAVSMLNKTSLLDIPDLVRRSIAVIGNDTGPSHIAAFSGRPNIAIFDQRTAASVTRGKQSINMVSPGTIDLITVDMVWEKLQPILEQAAR